MILLIFACYPQSIVWALRPNGCIILCLGASKGTRPSAAPLLKSPPCKALTSYRLQKRAANLFFGVSTHFLIKALTHLCEHYITHRFIRKFQLAWLSLSLTTFKLSSLYFTFHKCWSMFSGLFNKMNSFSICNINTKYWFYLITKIL